jgi:hypothetical protein
MSDRLQKALEGAADQLHQRLFYALAHDLNEACGMQASVPATKILELLEEYSVGEYRALGGL